MLFTCGVETIHMAPGECWLFDSFRWHRVENGWTERRVHLVLDTVMTESLRKLIDAAQSGVAIKPKYLAPGTHPQPELKFEQFNVSPIMSPWEVRCHLAFIFENAADHPRLPAARDRLELFADCWAAAWAQFGPSYQGLPAYRRLIGECRNNIAQIAGEEMALKNTVPLRTVLDSLIFGPALAPTLVSGNFQASVPGQRLAS